MSTPGPAGAGPLEDAARGGDVERVRPLPLLDGGADPNGRDGSGLTAPHRAVAGRRRDVAALLVARGADVDASDERGGTPLHVAAAAAGAAVVRLLLERGADVDAPDHEGVGAPPLRLAGFRRRAEVALPLREAGAAPPPVEPAAPLLPSGDAGRGRALFAETRGPRHATEAGGRGAALGPPLHGPVGRAVGSFPGFVYSLAMGARAGRWDGEAVNALIARPVAGVPGTRVRTDGLASAGDRADVIACLRSLGGGPPP